MVTPESGLTPDEASRPPYDVTCPKCGAQKSFNCATAKGRTLTVAHDARYKLSHNRNDWTKKCDWEDVDLLSSHNGEISDLINRLTELQNRGFTHIDFDGGYDGIQINAGKLIRVFSAENIRDLMVTAIEGVSRDWCRDLYPTWVPPTMVSPWYADPEVWGAKETQLRANIQDGPQNIPVAYESITEGCRRFRDEYQDRFQNFLRGDYDAEDADVFLQLCIFGEVVYG